MNHSSARRNLLRSGLWFLGRGLRLIFRGIAFIIRALLTWLTCAHLGA